MEINDEIRYRHVVPDVNRSYLRVKELESQAWRLAGRLHCSEVGPHYQEHLLLFEREQHYLSDCWMNCVGLETKEISQFVLWPGLCQWGLPWLNPIVDLNTINPVRSLQSNILNFYSHPVSFKRWMALDMIRTHPRKPPPSFLWIFLWFHTLIVMASSFPMYL